MQLVKEELELNRKNVRKIAGWIKLNQQIGHNTPQKDKSLRERWSGSPFIRLTDLYTSFRGTNNVKSSVSGITLRSG